VSPAAIGERLDVMRGADAGADPGARPEWQWDVALSFASAQRNYIEQVAEALTAQGVRCFYDADEQIELWGKYLAEELPVIYGEQAAAVVVFVSGEYAARDWTRLERRAALDRAVRERREFVLPARFDDTTLPGLLTGMVAIDLRMRTPKQFASMIVSKLAALGITGPTAPGDAGDPARHRTQSPESPGGTSVSTADRHLMTSLTCLRERSRNSGLLLLFSVACARPRQFRCGGKGRPSRSRVRSGLH
jgi:hypothetical protein